MKTNDTIYIALADDHAMLRKSLKEVINNMGGFSVIIDEDNGRALIEKIKAAKQRPDICVLDIGMPEMNGYETAAFIHTTWPEINILALSMYDNEFNIIKMLRSGAAGYVLKDSDPMELQKALNQIYKHSFYQSDIVSGHMINLVSKKDAGDLNENEITFLKHCCSELSYKEIAAQMNKSPRTIDGYREALFQKLQLSSRTGLVLYALRAGITKA